MEHFSVHQSDFPGDPRPAPVPRWRLLGNGLIAGLVVGLLLLIDIYPYRPATALGWVLFFGFAVPAVVIFQVVEEYLLTTSISTRLGEAGRWFVGMGFVVVMLACALALLEYAQPALTKW